MHLLPADRSRPDGKSVPRAGVNWEMMQDRARDQLGFLTVDAALSWAYQALASESLPVSRIYRMADERSGRRWLSGTERRAQAAWIVAEAQRQVKDMPRLAEWLRACYQHDFEGIDGLRGWIAAGLPTGVHRLHAVDKMLRMYLGESISVLSLRTDLRCRTEMAMRYRDITRERLDALRAELERVLRPVFCEKGWLT